MTMPRKLGCVVAISTAALLLCNIGCGGGDADSGDVIDQPSQVVLHIGGSSCAAFVQACADCEEPNLVTNPAEYQLPVEFTGNAAPGDRVQAWICQSCSGGTFTVTADVVWRGVVVDSQSATGDRVNSTNQYVCDPVIHVDIRMPQ